jgi:hypothetical protein
MPFPTRTPGNLDTQLNARKHACRRTRWRARSMACAVMALLLVLTHALNPSFTTSFTSTAQAAPTPAGATAILGVDQVRVGMKGYGLTVFHGSKVEPFACEVVSVMRDFAPQRSVIWIRCPDARMQLSGPVQGMSGSPIYLWSDNEPHTPGTGGRLIGAFAFGYSGSKDCYVGVQPIENMRGTGERMTAPAGRRAMSESPVGADTLGSTLAQLVRGSDGARLSVNQSWRLRGLSRALSSTENQANSLQNEALSTAPPPPLPGLSGRAWSMQLPLAIGSERTSLALAPLLEPMGLMPVQAGPSVASGKPPPDTDAQSIHWEPGGVLALPLAFGDADLSAVGTVTEVLPDGRVLAFGHAMFGQGDVSLPMATGYVHMVMPGLVSSFKLGGSAVIRGSLLRDEPSAVAGLPNVPFVTSPVTVTVKMPGQASKLFKYQVARHKRLTPLIAASLAARSMESEGSPPMESTAVLTGKIVFAGQRELEVRSMIPDPQAAALMMEVLTPLAAMAQNAHASVMLESMDLNVQVEQGVRASTLVNARLDRSTLESGDTVRGTLRLQAFGAAAVDRRFEFALPTGLSDGDYTLSICDAPTYLAMLLANRPHLMATSSADDVLSLLKRVLSIKGDALYLVMPLPAQGLAVGGQELPQLPSSRRALLAVPSSTVATNFTDWAEQVLPLDTVPSGNQSFTLSVRSEGPSKSGAMKAVVAPAGGAKR